MSMTPHRRFDMTAALACIATLACWSSAPIFIEYLTSSVDVWTQNLLRYAAACLFWLPLLLLDARAGRLTKSVFKRALLPAIPSVVMQTLWGAGFYYMEPAFVSLLAASALLWAVVFSVVFFRDERRLLTGVRFWLALALSMLGLVGVLVNKHGFAERYTIIGIVLILAYGFVWGLYTVAVKVAFKDIDSRTGFSVVTIYAVAGLAVLAAAFGRPSMCLAMSAAGWLSAIVSGIVAIALGHVLFYISIRRIGTTIPSLVQLSHPFVVLALSYAIYGESFTIPQILFGLVLLGGSALAISQQAPRESQSP
jgi:drug/metabolite transporter (DMT)-like permease